MALTLHGTATGAFVTLAALAVAACGGSSQPRCVPCVASGAGDSAGPAPLRSPKLEALANQRVELARKRLAQLRESFGKGGASLDELFAAFRDVAFAARDSGLRGAPLHDVLKDYRDAVIALKQLTRERVAKGTVTDEAMSRVEALEAEAEYWFEESGPLP
jgi:hypothetical protein